MKNGNCCWEILLKVSLGILLVLSFLQFKVKFGWDPFKKNIILIESIKVQDSILTKPNESNYLDFKINPSTASNKSLKWESSDDTIVEIDSTTGKFLTRSVGEAYITAFTRDGSNLRSVSKITVKEDTEDIVYVAVKEIQILNVPPKPIREGQTFQLVANVFPEEATYKQLNWVSSNGEIASVTETGLVKCISYGNCTIKVQSTHDASVYAEASFYIYPDMLVEKIVMPKSTTIKQDEKKDIGAIIFPSLATNKELSWRSSDSSIATVQNGTVKGINAGTCTIFASSTDGSGVKAQCNITVEAQALTNDNISVEAKIKRYLASFKDKKLAKSSKSLFSSNAIIKVIDDGAIYRKNALDYIDLVSSESSYVKKIKFVSIKTNDKNLIEELIVEELY